MGKCILAGHPPAGGQIGYGTYTGDGADTRTISLGTTPKWVLVAHSGIFFGSRQSGGGEATGGLAIAGSPSALWNGGNAVAIVAGGFQVRLYTLTSSYYYLRSNESGMRYNYIYGT